MTDRYGRAMLVDKIVRLIGAERGDPAAVPRQSWDAFVSATAERIVDELTVESGALRMPAHAAIVDVVARTLAGNMPFRTESYDPASEQQHGKIDPDVAHALGAQIASTLYASGHADREALAPLDVVATRPAVVFLSATPDGDDMVYDLSRDDMPAPTMGPRDAALARALLLLAIDHIERGQHEAAVRPPDTAVWGHTVAGHAIGERVRPAGAGWLPGRSPVDSGTRP